MKCLVATPDFGQKKVAKAAVILKRFLQGNHTGKYVNDIVHRLRCHPKVKVKLNSLPLYLGYLSTSEEAELSCRLSAVRRWVT
jgi:hypothetical protein